MDAKPFLASTSWDILEEINTALCRVGGYQAGRTSDGYAPAQKLWGKKHADLLTFLQVADLCRECHRLAPFLFLNGNTFASCARIALEPALDKLEPTQRVATRAALGHYIAGTLSRDELLAIMPSSL